MLAQVDGAGAGWSRTYANELRYDVFGNRTHARFGNGDVSNWTFDPARVRLTSLVTTLASATKVQDLRYTYDPAGNPTAIENALAATPVNNTLPGTATQSFAYDGVDRLVHATGAGTLGSNKRTTYDLAFTYSASHNITTKTSTHLVISNNGSSSAPSATNYNSPYTYAPGRPHLATQVGALSITYDPSGNPTSRTDSGSGEQLVWDDDNRMVRVTNATGVTQRNIYDASGVRVLRHGQGDTIFASPLFEFNASSTGAKHIFAGSTRVASVLAPFTSGVNQALPAKKGTAYFVHENHLGSTNVVTSEDGSVNDAHEYFPDGAAWIDSGKSSSVDGFLFSGKPFDPDTGFYDFGQRFYDPKTSIWLGDDASFKEKPTGALGAPYVLAVVSFAANSPIRLTDVDGRDATTPEGVLLRNLSLALGGRDAPGYNYDTLATTGIGPKEAAELTFAVIGGVKTWHNTVANVSAGIGDGLSFIRDTEETRRKCNITIVNPNSPEYAVGRIAGTVVAIKAGEEASPRSNARSAGPSSGSIGTKGLSAAEGVPALRQQYVGAVEGLAERVPKMRQAGMTSKQIARALHAERRALGEQFKALTPPDMIGRIYERNLIKYGDKLGPSIEWLRNAGKSWDDIIESASRPAATILDSKHGLRVENSYFRARMGPGASHSPVGSPEEHGGDRRTT